MQCGPRLRDQHDTFLHPVWCVLPRHGRQRSRHDGRADVLDLHFNGVDLGRYATGENQSLACRCAARASVMFRFFPKYHLQAVEPLKGFSCDIILYLNSSKSNTPCTVLIILTLFCWFCPPTVLLTSVFVYVMH